jgi:hypothetical protein
VQLGLVQSEPLRRNLEAWDANPGRAPIYLSDERRAASRRAGQARPANEEPPASQADSVGY